MNSLLQTMHNIQVPPMPADERRLVWLDMGQGVAVSPHVSLYAFRERQQDSEVSQLRLVLRYAHGNTLTAHTPEGLRYLCTDAVIRCVEDSETGPVRVLVELGDMVAFPGLRAVAA